MRRSALAAVAAIGSASLLLSACSKADDNGGDENKSAGANAATKGVVNASTQKGGTVTYEYSDVPDSFDPGNTYYAYMYNLSRLYARPLMTFAPGPGEEGNKLVPDLAESAGQPSDGGKTWTYKIRSGLKYQDGTPITSKDVKYAVERSNFARDVLSLGPNYFQQFLQGGDKYKGPYKDKSAEGLKSIETPDDNTIVFKLNRAFQEFDYLVATPQTAPVPQAKDTGVDYVKSIVSSGSYKFQSYKEGQQAVLVRNENWDAKTDPLRKQYPDKIVVKLKVNAETIDQDVQAGDAIDLGGTGVQAATQAKVVNDANLKSNTDNTYGGRLVYMAINTQVAPFDKVECRKAVQYAIDKVSVQTAEGGPIRGDIATTVLPPDIPGYEKADVYATTGNKGDAAKAKEQLKACGKSSINTNISARSDRPQEIDAATAIIASLKKVGINASLKQYPSGKYFTDYAGVPTFDKKQNIGLHMMQWGADWPSGYGFLQQILHGDAIGASGNTNLSYLNDKQINEMLEKAIATEDDSARNALYAQIDKRAMDLSALVPLTYFKVLLYRPAGFTNLVSTAAFSGQYDYLNIGTTKK
ncbi:peptide/nickel transport system substrate-binding protein [Streptomyces sp. SAI-135]|uniref:ABC transporter substrate-binding protein n=1 Tax=unclassified Streptomyces TaxID=2593676 RepID=UPI002476A835|nr:MULTISPECIES: ABC transporter substrate-binding protein [unclassified Streptomyces]MDH6516353.1 peptide/nickel transport system substrate-binding protein [Streptomyces sp. SAI-090]MDH6548547.1 peptide/nickel transport system substrate-binding protein [Streptomyces sp. SAI-041]MDH6587430.1 peptide/nickel transport system substrate-binding protein [Streptomyces sp. SAI-133]MDH6619557.1 peptide/nickel transport system substrate-binding protein [Streptomyces sp. SAI-135]